MFAVKLRINFKITKMPALFISDKVVKCTEMPMHKNYRQTLQHNALVMQTNEGAIQIVNYTLI